jgi:hypothetical protein
MLLWRMRRRFPAVDLRALAVRQARLLAAGAAGAAAALLLDLALPTTDLASLEVAGLLAVKAALALAVAVAAARLVAAPELAEGVRALRALVRGRRRRAVG